MGISDIGPRPQAFDLETETLENLNYRTVAWSGKYLQVTLMSIPVNGDIGLEKHPDTDLTCSMKNRFSAILGRP